MEDVRRRYANVPAKTKKSIAITNVSPARRLGIFRTTYAEVRSASELLARLMREYHWAGSTIGPSGDVGGRLKRPCPPVSELSTSQGSATMRSLRASHLGKARCLEREGVGRDYSRQGPYLGRDGGNVRDREGDRARPRAP